MEITKRKDGRYCTSVAGKDKRVYIYGKTKKEVMEKLRAFDAQKIHGRLFKEVADEWWTLKYDTLAVQSVHTYQSAYDRVVGYFGQKNIADITPHDISIFFKYLASKGFAQKTVSNTRIVINQILEYAVVETSDISLNPCVSVHVPKGLKKKKRRAASAEDEKTIRESTDVWLYPYFALTTGLRKGEILALTWEDIDFVNDYIHVSKSVAFDGNRPIIKSPKTEAGERIVPIVPPLKKLLIPIKSEGYVFHDSKGEPLSKSYFEKLWYRYKKITGVTATSHNLRHSFASFSLESGLNFKEIQEIIGHAQISTTMDVYADFREKALKSAAEKLSSEAEKNLTTF